MPASIPPGLTREHVLKALADLDAGADHPFGPATGAANPSAGAVPGRQGLPGGKDPAGRFSLSA